MRPGLRYGDAKSGRMPSASTGPFHAGDTPRYHSCGAFQRRDFVTWECVCEECGRYEDADTIKYREWKGLGAGFPKSSGS
jgi:hypothetical protein